MESELVTNSEKIHIINQHIKNKAYSLYNLEISILSENASSVPSQNTIDSLSQQIIDAENQIVALKEELQLIESESNV